MTPGRTGISQTSLGAILDLASLKASMPYYLYFYPDGGGDSLCLDHSRQAHYCRTCEAIIIVGTKTNEGAKSSSSELAADGGADEALACLACGQAISAG